MLQQKLVYNETEKVTQLNIEIQNVEYQLVSLVSTKRVLTLKKKQLTTDQLLTQTSNQKLKHKPSKFQYLCGLSAEKFDILLACLLRHTVTYYYILRI